MILLVLVKGRRRSADGMVTGENHSSLPLGLTVKKNGTIFNTTGRTGGLHHKHSHGVQ